MSSSILSTHTPSHKPSASRHRPLQISPETGHFQNIAGLWGVCTCDWVLVWGKPCWCGSPSRSSYLAWHVPPPASQSCQQTPGVWHESVPRILDLLWGCCLKHDLTGICSVRAMHGGRSFFLLPWSLIFPSFGPSIHSAGSKGYFCLCFRLITNLRGTCTCKPRLKGPLSPPHEVDISRLKFRIMVTSSFSTRNSTSAKFMAAQPSAQVLYAASDPSVS